MIHDTCHVVWVIAHCVLQVCLRNFAVVNCWQPTGPTGRSLKCDNHYACAMQRRHLLHFMSITPSSMPMPSTTAHCTPCHRTPKATDEEVILQSLHRCIHVS